MSDDYRPHSHMVIAELRAENERLREALAEVRNMLRGRRNMRETIIIDAALADQGKG
jgi:hypothetical protein